MLIPKLAHTNKDKDTIKIMENENALVPANESVTAMEALQSGEFDFTSLSPNEQLELFREIKAADAEIEMIGLPMLKSKDILNIPINIHDASFKDIISDGEQKTCVNFLCENIETGELFTVLKSSNAFNDLYVKPFHSRRGITRHVLQNYNFVEDNRWQKAGNPAVVLRKVQPQMKTVSKGK